MTKVTIISGFLGAGKTTLIKKLLKEAFAGEKCVLLENEYGEIGIDGGFMKESGIQITELNSGCICCTLAGDFEKAIDEIIDRFNPDRLIIEPSGVGKLSDIRRAVTEHQEEHKDIELTGCATVVDCLKCRMYMRNFGEFFADQVKCAETVVFSRTQSAAPEKLESATELIRAQNAAARIITTPWDDITGETILKAVESPESLIDVDELFPRHEHHHHHHDHEHECEHHHEHEHDHDHECEHHHDHEHDHDHECEHHHEHDHEHECEHHHGHDHEHEHHHEHGHHCCECGCDHDHDHDADEVFENIGIETVHKFDAKVLEEALAQLDNEEKYGIVLRAKGIVESANGGWLHFDYVPGEFNVRSGAADYTGRLCVIGTDLNKTEISALLGV